MRSLSGLDIFVPAGFPEHPKDAVISNATSVASEVINLREHGGEGNVRVLL